MDFNWSTFFLEILNFLILMWLVKRFFYKPVLKMINARQSEIEEKVANAKNIQSEAEKLQAQYENRLTAWEKEKQQRQVQLNRTLDENKNQQLALTEKLIKDEKQKQKSIQEKQLQIQRQQYEKQALDQGSRFTAALLKDLSSQSLEDKIIELFISNLSNYSPDQKQNLSNIYSDQSTAHTPIVEAVSAYSLSQANKDKLESTLHNLIDQPIQWNYQTDKGIIAGLRINMGSYVLRANLADELTFFSDSGNDSH